MECLSGEQFVCFGGLLQIEASGNDRTNLIFAEQPQEVGEIVAIIRWMAPLPGLYAVKSDLSTVWPEVQSEGPQSIRKSPCC